MSAENYLHMISWNNHVADPLCGRKDDDPKTMITRADWVSCPRCRALMKIPHHLRLIIYLKDGTERSGVYPYLDAIQALQIAQGTQDYARHRFEDA